MAEVILIALMCTLNQSWVLYVVHKRDIIFAHETVWWWSCWRCSTWLETCTGLFTSCLFCPSRVLGRVHSLWTQIKKCVYGTEYIHMTCLFKAHNQCLQSAVLSRKATILSVHIHGGRLNGSINHTRKRDEGDKKWDLQCCVFHPLFSCLLTCQSLHLFRRFPSIVCMRFHLPTVISSLIVMLPTSSH
jgi:hypothetical protein